ncbi:AsmA-like C-terminal region-containing protein [Tropicimonas sp. S265A]|uniref:AsmA-like C-terminal region-containing protein n=1 Tax=Tropicimonas sp. S265A TaxID=3415134 RepID=UPI003C7D18DF
MSDAEPTSRSDPAEARASAPTYSSRRRSGLLVVLAAGILLATLGGLSALLLRGTVHVPNPIVDLVEDRLRGVAQGQGIARIGAVELTLTDTWRPQLVVSDTVLRTRGGGNRLVVPRLDVTLSRRALLRGEVRPLDVTIDGAALRVTRRADGFTQLALQSGETLSEGPSLPAVIAGIEAFFDRAPLDQLETLILSNLSLQVTGGGLGRGVTLSGGVARVDVGQTRIGIALALDLEGAPPGAGASLRFETERHAPETRMSLRLRDLPAGLLAQQSPAFAALSAFDGSVTAQLDGALAPDGALDGLSGRVTLGAGGVEVPWQADPVAIDAATLSLAFDPGLQRFTLSDVDLRSDLARGALSGTIDLVPGKGDAIWPDVQFALTGRIDYAKLTPKLRTDAQDMGLRVEGRFSGPARRLDLGLVQLADHGTDARATGTGRVNWPLDAPPALALDLHLPRIAATRVAQFWPAEGKGSKLGRWLADNLREGTLLDTQAAVRLTRGAKPEIGVSFGYENAVVWVLPEFPDLISAHGHATLFDNRFLIRVGAGEIAPQGAVPVSVDGSSFEVVDTRIKGTDARLRLAVNGPATTLFDVLDRAPVRLGERFPMPLDKIAGKVAGSADFLIPLRRGAAFDLPRLIVDAQVSDGAIAGITETLDLSEATINVGLSQSRVELGGFGLLADMPVSFDLALPLSPDADPAPTVISGTARVNADRLASIGVRLPPDAVTGTETEARYRLTLSGPDVAPELVVTSELTGLGVSVPALGWSKPENSTAAFDAQITLGQPPQVDRLALSARGLEARGNLRLSAEDSSLEWLQLERFALADWLDVQVELVVRGPDQSPTIVLTGGQVDLRARPSLPTGSGGGQAGAFALRLDEVIVADGIALQNVRGTISAGRVFTGEVTGTLNGRAQVRLEIGPGPNGRQSLRLASGDGGGLLASAGILTNLRGGQLDLMIEETATKGDYVGQLKIADTLLVENPAAVEVLSALSIVGLVEQLATGGGISLTEVSADLQLMSRGIGLQNGLANGPSLGITFEGVVMPQSNRIDLQGVVSPFYMINSLGGGLFGTPGEGLIGVNYRVEGPRAAPRVTVNPFSVLTPGIFRDLFRRPPPQLTQ